MNKLTTPPINGAFRTNGNKIMMKQINANEHNKVKNPNWQETDELAIYKHGRGFELSSTKKQL